MSIRRKTTTEGMQAVKAPGAVKPRTPSSANPTRETGDAHGLRERDPALAGKGRSIGNARASFHDVARQNLITGADADTFVGQQMNRRHRGEAPDLGAPSKGTGGVRGSQRERVSGDDDAVFDSAGNNLGRRGDLEQNGKGQLNAGMTEAELERLGKDQETFRRAGIETEGEAQKLKEQMERELQASRGNAPKPKARRPREDDDGGAAVEVNVGAGSPRPVKPRGTAGGPGDGRGEGSDAGLGSGNSTQLGIAVELGVSGGQDKELKRQAHDLSKEELLKRNRHTDPVRG